MAANQKRDEAWDALVAQAAAEARALNPHIGERSQTYSDDVYAQLSEDARELTNVWDAIDRQRQEQGKSQTYSAADAVDEVRGE